MSSFGGLRHPFWILVATLFRKGVFEGSLARLGSPVGSTLIVLDNLLTPFRHRNPSFRPSTPFSSLHSAAWGVAFKLQTDVAQARAPPVSQYLAITNKHISCTKLFSGFCFRPHWEKNLDGNWIVETGETNWIWGVGKCTKQKQGWNPKAKTDPCTQS